MTNIPFKRLAFLLFLIAPAVFAQNALVPIPPIFVGPATNPHLAANVTITFCTPTATGAPCSPLAQAYSDSTNSFPINQSTNPIKTDALGNPQAFYAAPGQYSYTVTGPGIGTPQGPYQVTVSCIPGTTCVATSANNTFTGNNTHSGTETFTGLLNCKQVEGTLCIDNANTQGWAGPDFGARLNTAIAALPSIGGYQSGVIWIKNDSYVMTTAVTAGPYVLFRCEPGAVIDFQNTGVAFTFTASPFNYEARGGFENCKITNSTNNWTAGIKLQDVNFIHIWNTLVLGGGTSSAACLLFDSHGTNQYSEQTDIQHSGFSFCLDPIQFQVTGGTGSFAYTKMRGVELSPTGGAGSAGMLLINNAKINESYLDFNVFLPLSTPAFWLHTSSGSPSAIGLRGLNISCELQASVASAICIKTDTGTSLQAGYNEFTANASNITDSIAAGTLIPYAWNYAQSGLSQATATAAGLNLAPNGTAAGYTCAASCGAVNFDNNTQTAGTFPHLIPPANLGSNTYTYLLVPGGGNTNHALVQIVGGVAGCTTAASIGGTCATPITITWGQSFFDANYSVSCFPSGSPTNLPSTPYISLAKTASGITVNYFAITAAAASWTTIDCIAIHSL